MAVTGALLLGFVVAHLLGNLQVYAGPEKFNAYAAFLKSLGPVLWIARIGLLAVFVLHFVTAFRLWRLNSGARPEEYRAQSTVQATSASLYMMQSGMVILIFVLLHLMHFTFGLLQPQYFTSHDHLGRHDVYAMLIRGFQSPGYTIGYCIAMLALGFHLSHACSSMFQTMGLHHPAWTPKIRAAGFALGWLIALAYISIPVSVAFGVIALPY